MAWLLYRNLAVAYTYMPTNASRLQNCAELSTRQSANCFVTRPQFLLAAFNQGEPAAEPTWSPPWYSSGPVVAFICQGMYQWFKWWPLAVHFGGRSEFILMYWQVKPNVLLHSDPFLLCLCLFMLGILPSLFIAAQTNGRPVHIYSKGWYHFFWCRGGIWMKIIDITFLELIHVFLLCEEDKAGIMWIFWDILFHLTLWYIILAQIW